MPLVTNPHIRLFMPSHPHVSVQVQLDGLPQNLMLGTLMKICHDPYLVKIEQKHRAYYMKAYVHFPIVADIKSPKKCSRLVK